MNLTESFMTGTRSLLTHKLRSFLTMLGIIIGVAAVIGLVSIGEGARKNIAEQFEKLGSNLIIVHSQRYDPQQELEITGSSEGLTYEDGLAILQECPSVMSVAPEITHSVVARYLGRDYETTLTGTTPAYQGIRNFYPEAGRFFSQEDVDNWKNVCVLGKTVKEELFGEKDPIGKVVKIGNNRFVVIGVMQEKGQAGFQDYDDTIFIPLTAAQKRFTGKQNVRGLLVKAKSAEVIDELVTEVNNLLTKRHYNVIDFRVRNQAEFLEALEQAIGTLKLLLGGIASIALLVGGIGIMNIMLVSVTERTREIGIRKAIGAKRRDILSQFLIESTVLSLLGGIIGILFGFLLGPAVSLIFRAAMGAGGGPGFTSVISGSSIIIAFCFSAAIGIFFGMYPANKASKLDPIEALRYE